MFRALCAGFVTLISASVFAASPSRASGNPNYAQPSRYSVLSSQNDYNFRFHPISLIVGALSAEFDIRVSDQWTVGPEVNYWNIKFTSAGTSASTFEIHNSSIGVRANWFKNDVFTDGLYVGPFVRYTRATVNATGTTSVTGDASGIYFGSLIGYGWFWDSFNMMLGGGVALASGTSNIVVTESNGQRTEAPNNAAGFTAEYSLGWTF